MSVRVESLDQEARGIARANGKAVFIDGALPGELVDYSPYRKKPNYDLAQLSVVIHPSAMRVEPRCIYFAKCGGCNMQHLDEGKRERTPTPTPSRRPRDVLSCQAVCECSGRADEFVGPRSSLTTRSNSCPALPFDKHSCAPAARIS